MKISELIAELNLFKEKYGDVNVHLQYMDDGGAYNGNTAIEYVDICENECDNSMYVLIS